MAFSPYQGGPRPGSGVNFRMNAPAVVPPTFPVMGVPAPGPWQGRPPIQTAMTAQTSGYWRMPARDGMEQSRIEEDRRRVAAGMANIRERQTPFDDHIVMKNDDHATKDTRHVELGRGDDPRDRDRASDDPRNREERYVRDDDHKRFDRDDDRERFDRLIDQERHSKRDDRERYQQDDQERYDRRDDRDRESRKSSQDRYIRQDSAEMYERREDRDRHAEESERYTREDSRDRYDEHRNQERRDDRSSRDVYLREEGRDTYNRRDDEFERRDHQNREGRAETAYMDEHHIEDRISDYDRRHSGPSDSKRMKYDDRYEDTEDKYYRMQRDEQDPSDNENGTVDEHKPDALSRRVAEIFGCDISSQDGRAVSESSSHHPETRSHRSPPRDEGHRYASPGRSPDHWSRSSRRSPTNFRSQRSSERISQDHWSHHSRSPGRSPRGRSPSVRSPGRRSQSGSRSPRSRDFRSHSQRSVERISLDRWSRQGRSPDRRSPGERSPGRRSPGGSPSRRAPSVRSPDGRSRGRRSPDSRSRGGSPGRRAQGGRSPGRRSPDSRSRGGSPGRRAQGGRSPGRRSHGGWSPGRRSPSRRSPGGRSPYRRSPGRRSRGRRSPGRRSPGGRSTSRSPGRRWPSRRLSGRRSPGRRSSIRRSPIRRSRSRSRSPRSGDFRPRDRRSTSRRSNHSRSPYRSHGRRSPRRCYSPIRSGSRYSPIDSLSDSSSKRSGGRYSPLRSRRRSPLETRSRSPSRRISPSRRHWSPDDHRSHQQDWKCSECGNYNFRLRVDCYKCLCPREGGSCEPIVWVAPGFHCPGNTPEELEKRVYVNRLTMTTTAQDLAQHFNNYGRVVYANLVINAKLQRPKGYGFVSFFTKEDADRVLKSPHQICGNVVHVHKNSKKLSGGKLEDLYDEISSDDEEEDKDDDRYYMCKVKRCSFKGVSKEFRKHWSDIHTSHKKYLICPVCDSEFTDRKAMKNHLTQNHGVTDVGSTLNNILGNIRYKEKNNPHYIDPGSMEKEEKVEISQKYNPFHVFQCPETGCPFSASAKPLLQHWSTKHLNESSKLICPVCAIQFVRLEMLMDHLRTGHGIKRPVSLDSNRIVSGAEQISSDEEETDAKNSGEKYRCLVNACRFIGLKHHFKLHWERKHEAMEKYFACPYCGIGCTDQPKISHHIVSQHNLKKDDPIVEDALIKSFLKERPNPEYMDPGNVEKEAKIEISPATDSNKKKEDEGKRTAVSVSTKTVSVSTKTVSVSTKTEPKIVKSRFSNLVPVQIVSDDQPVQFTLRKYNEKNVKSIKEFLAWADSVKKTLETARIAAKKHLASLETSSQPKVASVKSTQQGKVVSTKTTQKETVSDKMKKQEKDVARKKTQEKDVARKKTQEKDVARKTTQEKDVTRKKTQERGVTPKTTQEKDVTRKTTQEKNVTPKTTQEKNITRKTAMQEKGVPGKARSEKVGPTKTTSQEKDVSRGTTRERAVPSKTTHGKAVSPQKKQKNNDSQKEQVVTQKTTSQEEVVSVEIIPQEKLASTKTTQEIDQDEVELDLENDEFIIITEEVYVEEEDSEDNEMNESVEASISESVGTEVKQGSDAAAVQADGDAKKASDVVESPSKTTIEKPQAIRSLARTARKPAIVKTASHASRRSTRKGVGRTNRPPVRPKRRK